MTMDVLNAVAAVGIVVLGIVWIIVHLDSQNKNRKTTENY